MKRRGFARPGPVLVAVLLLLSLQAGCRQDRTAPPGKGRGALPSFDDIADPVERKKSFFRYLRPMIEAENRRILRQRERIQQLYDRHRAGGTVPWTDIRWIHEVMAEYGIGPPEAKGEDLWEKLLLTVDIVPIDLALVQAAKESGWGTSRFAREGNNLFGQRCLEEGCGLVPQERADGETYEVATFESVRTSVESYIRNLNTHGAYRRFRKLRLHQRRRGEKPDGYTLVEGLPRYSERRELYLEEIRAMIRANVPYFDS